MLRAGGGLALEAGDVDATYGRRAFIGARPTRTRRSRSSSARTATWRSRRPPYARALPGQLARAEHGGEPAALLDGYRTHGGAALRFRFNNDDATICVEAPHLVLGAARKWLGG